MAFLSRHRGSCTLIEDIRISIHITVVKELLVWFIRGLLLKSSYYAFIII